jgi:hypothetical protein
VGTQLLFTWCLFFSCQSLSLILMAVQLLQRNVCGKLLHCLSEASRHTLLQSKHIILCLTNMRESWGVLSLSVCSLSLSLAAVIDCATTAHKLCKGELHHCLRKWSGSILYSENIILSQTNMRSSPVVLLYNHYYSGEW